MFSKPIIEIFNNSESHISMLLNESSDEKIYNNLSQDLIIGSAELILYKLVKVDAIFHVNGETYFRFNYTNKIKGIIKGIKPLLFIPKARQQVKFHPSDNITNLVNEKLNIENKALSKNQPIIVFSTMYVVYENQLFEGLMHGKEFIGFVPVDHLHTMQRFAKVFNLKSNITVYSDSNLTKEFDIEYHSKDTFSSDYYIPDENVVRFKYKNKICWVSLDNTNIQQLHVSQRPVEIDQALTYSIVYQISDRLRKSHQYYQRILAKEIKKVEDKIES